MTDAPANDAEPTEDDVFEQKAVRLAKRERLLTERADAAGGPYPVVVPVTDTIPHCANDTATSRPVPRPV